uniref:Venom peptide Htglin alpha n=1 Tax=Hadogenes troglodytes TaxID=1577150 RepID=A0A1B3IJ26_9SCOR|nr:venom peptide Htglin alpha [Hadogenes troglodytes]
MIVLRGLFLLLLVLSCAAQPTRVCTKPNEVLDNSGCFSVCTGRGTSYFGCPFNPIPNCRCKKGFASDSGGGLNGNCVPINRCRGKK